MPVGTRCHWLLGLGLWIGFASGVFAVDLKAGDFKALYESLRTDKHAQFPAQAEAWKDSLLYPYLEFRYWHKYPERAQDAQIRAFLTRYAETPLAQPLRRRWLEYLAEQQQWPRYLAFYEDSDSKRPALQCYQLQAQLHTLPSSAQSERQSRLESALQLWLTGQQQPSACQGLAKLLKAAGYLTPERYWQRLQLVLAKDKPDLELAGQLQAHLPNAHKGWVKRWQAMRDQPEKSLTQEFAQIKKPEALTEALWVYGLKRLARRETDTAYSLWQSASARLGTANNIKAQTEIGLQAAYQHQPEAVAWLKAIPPADRTETVQQWLILSALRQQDWATADQALATLKPDLQQTEQWRYWRARVLKQRGETAAADSLFRALAGLTGYYGFLAADQLNQPYVFNHVPIQVSTAELTALQQNPAIQRAKALLDLGLKVEARGEWAFIMPQMSPNQLRGLAVLAQQWDWPDQAIVSTAKARDFSDLVIRFPLAYQTQILALAEQYQLDPAWIYGITRTESTFTEDIRSAAGATGLMQLMPDTAREMARREKLDGRAAQLVVPAVNLQLGSVYLKLVLNQLGHLALATAAYNAGPSRPKRWRADLPADIWVDTIPFNETRDYVQRVMFYSTVYAYRLQRPIVPLKQRMPAITGE